MRKKLIRGDAIAGIAHAAFQKWGIRPREFASMDAFELAFIAASFEEASREIQRENIKK